MKRFVEGADRGQSTLLPECLDDWVDDENPVRAIDAFVDALDLRSLGFDGIDPAATGRPSFHPSVLLKLYIYGYLNRVQSSRRLEREAGRNLELLWLLGRLVPDHKTIADFRKETASVYARSAHASWSCAASWDCSRRRASPSTALSSRRSTIATVTSRRARWSAVGSRPRGGCARRQHRVNCRRTQANPVVCSRRTSSTTAHGPG